MEDQIQLLIKREIDFRFIGSVEDILNEMEKVFFPNEFGMIFKDINKLLYCFNKITDFKKFKLLLTVIDTNMCRRFHTDFNSLRMLCTYAGPGTLWLTEDNINREALDTYGDNKSLVIDQNSIQQVNTGSVIILKGNKYSGKTKKGIVHRSPSIEGSGLKRLMLRIDRN